MPIPEAAIKDVEAKVLPTDLQAVAKIFAVGALRAAQAHGKGGGAVHEENAFSQEGGGVSAQEADATPAPKHPG